MSSRGPNSLLSTSYDETFDYLFKIVLIGDCGTGKTCVVQRFKTGQYEERHGNTIGVDFSMKTVNIDGKKIKVSHFECGNYNTPIPLIKYYYSHISQLDGIIVVYSVNDVVTYTVSNNVFSLQCFISSLDYPLGYSW